MDSTTSAKQEPPKKIITSATQIEWLTRKCGEFYYRRWILKERVPPKALLHKGSAVHTGSEENFRQKIKTGVDLSAAKIQGITAAAFDERVKTEGFGLTPAEEKIGYNLVLARTKDRAVNLAGIYTREVAPVHQPIIVEEKMNIELAPGVELVAKMDLINSRDQIVDLKNSKQAWNQKRADGSIQLSLYALAYRALFKKDPAGLIIENLVDAPKNPKRVQLETKRSVKALEKAVQDINLFLYALQSGTFLPARRGEWFCNEDHCGFAETCRYFQFYKRGGGKVSTPFWMKRKKKEEAKA